MFEWFRVHKAKERGMALAKLLQEHAPPDTMRNERKRSSKINYAKEKMQKSIKQFKHEEVLNFYKTATLLNTFKWELKDAGYDEEVIDALGSWVHLNLREP